MKRSIKVLLFLAMTGAAMVVAAGFFGQLHPAFDTLSNFRLHLGAALIAMTAIWTTIGGRRSTMAFGLAGLVALAGSSPGLPLRMAPAEASLNGDSLRLFSMNLLWANPTPEAVVDAIDKLDPDFIVLLENTPRWRTHLAALDEVYPYRSGCSQHHNHGGSQILSKYPFLDEPAYCGAFGSLALRDLDVGGKRLTLGAVHLRWPWPASGPRLIDGHLPALAELGENALIAGDFNSVTWSHSVRRFAEAGGLSVVEGIGSTWGPGLVRKNGRLQWPQWLGLPIDNVAAKGGVGITSAETLGDLGSDHLPIVVDFRLQ